MQLETVLQTGPTNDLETAGPRFFEMVTADHRAGIPAQLARPAAFPPPPNISTCCSLNGRRCVVTERYSEALTDCGREVYSPWKRHVDEGE